MICATQFVCPFNSGPRSALFKCLDGQFYAVKFGWPDVSEPLCTEFLSCKLAGWVGLPTLDVEIVHVDECLLDHSAEMTLQEMRSHFVDAGTLFRVKACVGSRGGSQLGSRYPINRTIFNSVLEKMLSGVENLKASSECVRRICT